MTTTHRGWRARWTSLFRWRHKRLRYVGLEAAEALVVLVWATANGVVLAWQLILQLSQVTSFGMEVGVLARVARATGHVNNLNMGLLLLPIARNSLWQPLLGISYERFIRLHRWCARFLLMNVTLHMLLWWAVWIDLRSRNPLPADESYLRPVAIVGHCAWLVGMIMFSLAFHYVRRRFFEVFYYTHHLFIVFIGLSLAHNFLSKGFDFATDLLLYYVAPGIFFYTIDRAIRWRRSRVETDLVSLAHQPGGILFSGRVTRLEVLRADMSYEPGQYCFVNVPAISRLEWHPFSIASAPHEKTLRFIVQAKHPNSWSDKLYSLAFSTANDTASAPPFGTTPTKNRKKMQELSFSGTVDVKVDGPYGDFSYYYTHAEIVVLIGGGIGITPLISILQHLVHKMTAKPEYSDQGDDEGTVKKLYFYWACKKETHFRWVAKELGEIQRLTADDPRFEFLLFVTSNNDNLRQWSSDIRIAGGHSGAGEEGSSFISTVASNLSRKIPSQSSSINRSSPSSTEMDGDEPQSLGETEIDTDREPTDPGWRGRRGSKRTLETRERVRPPESEKSPLIRRKEARDVEKGRRNPGKEVDSDEEDIALPIEHGRPDLYQLLLRAKEAHIPSKGAVQDIHVLCCGPAHMAQTVCGLCDDLSDWGTWMSSVTSCCSSHRGRVNFRVGAYNFLL